jgi:hypothetical protein
MLALCLIMMGSDAAFAQFDRITSLTGNPPLGGDRSGYNITLVTAGAQTSLTLTATAGGSGNGTSVRWSIVRILGSSQWWPTFNEKTEFTYGNSTQNNITFPNASANDRFRITAELQSSSYENVGANAVVEVSFVNPVDLSGVTLDKHELYVRPGAGNTYLTAVPSPPNATQVIYRWESLNPGIATYTPVSASNDSVLVTGAYPGYSTTIRVTATGENNTPHSDECLVTVVERSEIADDMRLPAASGSLEEILATGLYAVDSTFVKEAYDGLNDSEIKNSSGYPASTPRYILTPSGISPTPLLNVDRSAIAETLGITNYDSDLVAALRLDLIMSPPMARGDMLPLVLSFKLNGLNYMNGTEVTAPSSAQDFHDRYRIVKYFERSSTRYSIDISDVLNSKSPGSYVRLENGSARIVPLIIIVDDTAPDSCDRRVGSQNEYGVKYDQTNQILFIYDGKRDTIIADPITLERRASSGGGGGGGCDAGAGFATVSLLAAGAFIALKSKKG